MRFTEGNRPFISVFQRLFPVVTTSGGGASVGMIGCPAGEACRSCHLGAPEGAVALLGEAIGAAPLLLRNSDVVYNSVLEVDTVTTYLYQGRRRA